ncbi:hypothetical protein [Peribacillus simplex]|uniref:hypothetical protein n=1 Tax=Peribacillus simplex TaxID=1478 RepID=UPI003D2B70AB
MYINVIVQLVLMFVVPAFLMLRLYKKMSEEERNEVKTAFTSKHFIFTFGLVTIGCVLFLLEPIFEMTWMETIGVILLSIGIMADIVLTWLDAPSKRKAMLKTIILLIPFSIFLWAVTT